MSKPTFEKSMKNLEQIVQELESGDIPLETAIKKFEEGVRISKFCSEILDEMEKKVTILQKKNDGTVTEDDFRTQESGNV